MSRRAWTRAEDARLRKLYPITPTPELPALLGRSRLAIKVRAAALHLRKAPGANLRRPWTAAEDDILHALNPEYAAMARRRIHDDAPLFAGGAA